MSACMRLERRAATRKNGRDVRCTEPLRGLREGRALTLSSVAVVARRLASRDSRSASRRSHVRDRLHAFVIRLRPPSRSPGEDPPAGVDE